MKKAPPICPNCGTGYDPEALLKSRRRSIQEEKAREPQPEQEEVSIMDVETPEAEGEDEAVIEDAEELEEDAPLEDVVEVEEEGPAA